MGGMLSAFYAILRCSRRQGVLATGYPPPLVLNLEPEGVPRDVYRVCGDINCGAILQQGSRRLGQDREHSAGAITGLQDLGGTV